MPEQRCDGALGRLQGLVPFFFSPWGLKTSLVGLGRDGDVGEPGPGQGSSKAAKDVWRLIIPGCEAWELISGPISIS